VHRVGASDQSGDAHGFASGLLDGLGVCPAVEAGLCKTGRHGVDRNPSAASPLAMARVIALRAVLDAGETGPNMFR